MRLIQLNPNGSEANALDFHPKVTVVSGLSALGRDLVINAVSALPCADDPGCHGLLEAHGVLLDLSPDTLRLLDLGRELDVVVRATDVPGAVSATGHGVGTLPGIGATLSPERFLEATPAGVHPELDQARASQADAREALAVLKGAVDKARQAYLEATINRQQLEARVEDLRSRRTRANLRLVTDEYEPEADEEIDLGPEESVAERRQWLTARIAEIDAELVRVEKGLEELTGLDTRPVQVLLDAIHNPAPVEYVPSERGAVLADQFERLQAEVGVIEADLEARGMDTASALARLDAAQAELAAAEKAMRPPEYTDAEQSELEAAHDEVLEAERKARGRGGKRRLEEALAAEQAILDRIGFPTWTAYVMGAGLMGIDPLAERRLENARAEMAAAEAHWAEVTSLIEADPQHRRLLDEIEAVHLEAFDLLHGQEPEDLAAALRDLQEPKQEVTTEELADALIYQLELVGLQLPPGVGVDTAVMAAEALLAETAAVTERIGELEVERTALLTERGLAQADLDTLPVDLGPTGGAEDDDPEASIHLDDMAAEGGLDEDGLEALERELATAVEDENDYAELVEAREALVDTAVQVESVATMRVTRLASELAAAHNEGQEAAEAPVGAPESESAFDDVDDVDAGPEAVEFYLLARLADLRNVSFAGSVPLLIDDALAGMAAADVRQVLGKLERMSESVQIIYLSDDPDVQAWAEGAGFEAAAVVPAPPALA